MNLSAFLITVISFSYFKSSYSSQKSEKYSYALNSQQKFYSTISAGKVSIKSNQSMVSLNYCSFFNNRAPSPQINLKNCTWYNENSCCLQSEIESTFMKVKPLIGSSELCQKYINNLMCYICAPNQFKFYGKERLTVCSQFCDKMYDACGEAILKGSKINEIYSNGEEFCKSRRYNIDDIKKDKCFHYAVEDKVNSSHRITLTKFSLYIKLILFYFLIHFCYL